MIKNVLVIGATSLIAYEFLRRYCGPGDRVALLGRNMDECQRIEADLSIRCGIVAESFFFDADSVDDHKSYLEPVTNFLKKIDLVFFAIGTVQDQTRTLSSVDLTKACINSNFLSIATVTGLILDDLKKSQSGRVVVLSSVAGDRGRAINFTYGASKAASNTYMQGLRQYLYEEGVKVHLMKLGFTDTRMVYGEERKLFCVSPKFVAKQVIKAINKDKSIAYVPFLWKWIMLVIRMIPESIFAKLKI